MLQPRSLMKIVDNSGGKLCRILKLLKKTPKSKLGDLAVVSLQKVKVRKIHKGKKKERLKKGEIRLALIIYIRWPCHRLDGSKIQLNKNYALLVSTKGKSLGTRYKLPLPRELRSHRWMKVVSMAPSFF